MAAAESEIIEEVPERSIRDELLAARDEIEAREAEPAEATPETPKAERARDESGKFVPKEASQLEAVVPKESPQSAVQPSPEPTSQQAAPSFVGAPNSWSNAAKAKWTALDPEIRAEIAKRESDMARGFAKVDEERSFAKEVQRITQPYEAAIRAAGGTVPQAVQSLLNTAYILQTADPVTKAREIAKVIQFHGIDLNLVSQPQEVNPQIAALQQEVAQLRGGFSQQTQMQQQAAEQQVMAMIDTFGRDPKNKYFHAVQADMGQLIGSGYAGTLEQAYEAAIWARPDIRAQQLSDQQAADKAKHDAAQKAQRARTKGVSVRGGPGGSPAPVVNPNSSVRQDLEAAFEEARGRI
jgi:hypothetical protein